MLGQAKPALRFQIPSQASLHGILKTHRSSAMQMAPIYCALRNVYKLENRGLRLVLQAGGRFEKKSQDRLQVSLQNGSSIRVANQPWVFGGQIASASSVYIREIRG